MAGEGDRERWLAQARAMEQRGEVDAAAASYQRAGDVDEAARVLVAAGRFDVAARMLVAALGVPLNAVGTLPPAGRRLAQKAAVCLARAGDGATAAEIYVALGDHVRAGEVLARGGTAPQRGAPAAGAGTSAPGSLSGGPAAIAARLEQGGHLAEAAQAYVQLRRPGDAARCLLALGRPLEAAPLLMEAGHHAEAAQIFFDAGDARRFLEAAVRTPKEHPRFRALAARAVAVAHAAGALGFALDQLFSRFADGPPRGDAEAEAYYRLAMLYRRHDYTESAEEVLEQLVAARPGYRDAEEVLASLSQAARRSSVDDARLRREDAAFLASAGPMRKATAPPELPELPDLPPLPQPRGAAPKPLDRTVAPATPQPQQPASQPQPLERPRSSTRPGPGPATRIDAVAPQSQRETAGLRPSFEPLDVGAMVADRYRLEARLGIGGMAEVFRAFDTELGESVAVKVFTLAADDPQLLQRFRQELMVARQLAHPNIVRLYDIGTHQGRKFLTMELLTGQDLDHLLRAPMELRDAVGYLVQACAGLDAVHARGIVHRDIKPDNLFVTDGGVLKVMDFGIAKQRTGAALTVAGFMAGTPEYMAPEQIQDFGTVTGLADVYALGIVAYRMFTGRVPFTHTEIMPLLMMHITQAPRPMRELDPSIPDDLDELVLRMLEKDPAKRVQGCRDVARELRRILR